METNNIKIGDFTFDAFITSDGKLGLTVYEAGKDARKDETGCVDIFVSRDTLKVTHV